MNETYKTTINGAEVEIPPEIAAQTKFTKAGTVDKRADHSAFDAWLAEQMPKMNGDEGYYPETTPEPTPAPLPPSDDLLSLAQSYAERLWEGQSNVLKPEIRRGRILAALEAQNLPTHAIDWPDERRAPDAPPPAAKPQEREQSADDVAKAQAYALRIWDGQTPTIGRSVRIERVRKALEGQGFSMYGVELPKA